MTNYHHGNLKNSIIEAGINIIFDEGIEKLSIRATAKLIGVSHTAPYRHFKNKEELIVAIALKGFEKLEGKIKSLKNYSNTKDLMVKTGKIFIEFACDNRNYYRIMFGNYINNKTDYHDFFEAYDKLFKRLTEIILKYKNQKLKKCSTDEASITAIAIFSILHGYSLLIIDNNEDKNIGQKKQINSILKKIENLLD
ncbi:MAG: TetR/AcrR family transcriptional regulator [Desulfobacterales bacterium]|nr:TetR/AcrR family transcriptional regulator [Desulfobacterales bacterium]MCP4161508.1 TetR/AcrR family transcriptional regulator [Deltaproteobacteria bacterium]